VTIRVPTVGFEDDLSEFISRALQPHRSDVVRAKTVALEILMDRKEATARTLIFQLSNSEGLVDSRTGGLIDGLVELESRDTDGIRKAVEASQAIRQRRLVLSSMHAVAEMAAAGLILPAVGSSSDLSQNFVQEMRQISPQHRGGTDAPILAVVSIPKLDDTYTLPDRFRDAPPWYLDHDLFLGELSDLNLNSRTQRTLEEALEAFRRGLYLAALSLLGAVTEGAWFAAGEALKTTDTRLAKALEGISAPAVQSNLARIFRELRVSKPPRR
jgi:hypothetical protein